MDNILIFAKTEDLLREYTRLVLQQLQKHDLYLKPKKCEFKKEKIKYLGIIVQQGKISMDLVKLGGFQDWPIPTSIKDVRSCLGFGNFY